MHLLAVDSEQVTWQRFFYLVSRTLGDGRAVQRGTYGKRLLRREVTRTLGRPYNQLWR